MTLKVFSVAYRIGVVLIIFGLGMKNLTIENVV